MICPKCGSNNVNVQVVQTSAKTRKRGAGCLWGIFRLLLIICTLGLWLLIGSRKGVSKTKFTNEIRGVCQNCGHTWIV